MTTEKKALADFAEEESTYFLRCSDCENVTGDWSNQALAGMNAHRLGWIVIGNRVVCGKCAKGYAKQETSA